MDKIFARWHLAIAITSYSLNILISNNPKIQYFPIFQKFSYPPPQFFDIKNIQEIMPKFSRNNQK